MSNNELAQNLIILAAEVNDVNFEAASVLLTLAVALKANKEKDLDALTQQFCLDTSRQILHETGSCPVFGEN